MITLTAPAQINSILGGNAPVAYDRLVLSSLTYNPVDVTISSTIRLSSTASPDMQAITGTLSVSAATFANEATGKLEVSVPQLDFYRRVTLSVAELAVVTSLVQNAQDSVETGLVAMGIIAGTHTTGV